MSEVVNQTVDASATLDVFFNADDTGHHLFSWIINNFGWEWDL